MSIGKKLKELLNTQEIETIALAEHLGIPPESLSSYLEDKREPDINMPDKIAKYLSVELDYFTDRPKDILECSCKGLTLGYIENMQENLSDHQKLINYLIYEIDNISTETLDSKHIYTYMLGLSNDRVAQICNKLGNYTLNERKRILAREFI